MRLKAKSQKKQSHPHTSTEQPQSYNPNNFWTPGMIATVVLTIVVMSSLLVLGIVYAALGETAPLTNPPLTLVPTRPITETPSTIIPTPSSCAVTAFYKPNDATYFFGVPAHAYISSSKTVYVGGRNTESISPVMYAYQLPSFTPLSGFSLQALPNDMSGYILRLDTLDNAVIALMTLIVDEVESLGVVKYNLNGSLNSEFGTDGVVILEDSKATYYIASLLVANNRIYTGGSSTTDSNRAVISCLNKDTGAFDLDFGTSGKLDINLVANNFLQVVQMFSTVDNKLWFMITVMDVVGISPFQFITVKASLSGVLDVEYGTYGIKTYDFGTGVFGCDCVYDAITNSIVASPILTNMDLSTTFPKLVKILADGSLDYSFGTSGIVSIPTAVESPLWIYTALAQVDGSIRTITTGTRTYPGSQMGTGSPPSLAFSQYQKYDLSSGAYNETYGTRIFEVPPNVSDVYPLFISYFIKDEVVVPHRLYTGGNVGLIPYGMEEAVANVFYNLCDEGQENYSQSSYTNSGESNS